MIGEPPDVPSFHEHFDWPDAVIPLPYGSSDAADLLADLDRDPNRLERASRDNLTNALRRHDWLHRWRRVLETIGLPALTGLEVRQGQLHSLAP